MNRNLINYLTILLAAAATTALLPASAARAAEAYLLSAASQRGQTTHVRVVLNVEGHLKLAGDGKVDKLPLKVAGNLRYHERIIEVDAKNGYATRSVRQYETAEAAITIKTNPMKQTLPADHRRIAVASGAAGVTTADFLRMPVARYSSRIRELRQIGFVIQVDRIIEGLFRYTLVSSPAVPKSLPTFEPKPRQAFTPSLFPSANEPHTRTG